MPIIKLGLLSEKSTLTHEGICRFNITLAASLIILKYLTNIQAMTIIEPLCLVLSFVIAVHCTMEDFLVGGELATIVSNPHCAFLLTTCKKGVAFACGGSILNQKMVLTAAHCLLVCQNDKPKITVSVGSSERNIHRTKVSDFILHEHFNEGNNIENDIALVKIKRTFKFSPQINRVAIMKRPPYSKYAIIAGWGLIDEETSMQTNLLMKLQLQIWKKKDCLKLLDRIPPHTFCAGHKDHSRFVSVGDSGSPMVINNYVQIGIISYKIPKLANYLAVYTNVSQFYDWIQFNAKKMYCNN